MLSYTVVSVLVSGLFLLLYCTYILLPLACNRLASAGSLSFTEIFKHFFYSYIGLILVGP